MNTALKLAPTTLAEFAALEKEPNLRYELLDGMVLMSPRPTKRHQKINFSLAKAVDDCLGGSHCDVYMEIELHLEEDIIIPDISVICEDDDKDAAAQKTPPLIVMEILSPSTAHRDLWHKLDRYGQLGIAEYWIIDPKSRTITVHDFIQETSVIYNDTDSITSSVKPEIHIDAAKIFA